MNKLIYIILFGLLLSCEQQTVKTKSSNELCTISDAALNDWDTTNAASALGIKNFEDISNCKIATCSSNFSLNRNGKECVPTVISCPISNGTGTRTWSESFYEPCLLQSCNLNYESFGNSCTPIACTLINSNIDQATSVSGTLVSGCAATGCAAGYYLDSGLCPQLNCDPTYQYVDGNVCADKDIVNPEFSFNNDYSNNRMANQVSFGSTSLAKEIAVYSNSDCSTMVSDFVSITNFSGFINLNDADGIQTFFVKYRNNSKTSACIGDSIILDRLSPNLSLTLPAINSSLAGDNFTLSGDCSEINPSNIQISATITGKEPQYTNCNNGAFSFSLNISDVSDGQFSIILNSTDLSANNSNQVISFSKITCSSFQDTVGNICVDKDPSGSIAFGSDYTKNLVNAINITSADAQSLNLYSDSNCQSILPSVSLPLSTHNVSLVSGDGIKYISAKFINGSKSSECSSDSIVLDQTIPDLSFSYPASNANIAGDSLTVTGACQELNSENIALSISLNNETQEAVCTDGEFTSNFDISLLTNAQYEIVISATDLANNLSEVSTSFNKIECDSFQHLDVNSCIDNDIENAAIAFSSTYSNNLVDNNVNLFITSNAKILEIYSDVLCSSEIINYDLASFNGKINLPMGSDGLRTLYAKYVNESKSSDCLPLSITLDRQNPVVAFQVYPELNILTNSITIAGTCSDENSGISNLEINNISLGQHILSCSSGSFSKSIDITSIPFASPSNTFNFTAQILDNAGNSGSATSQTFSRVKDLTISFTLANSQFGKVSSSINSFVCSSATCSQIVRNNQNITLNAELLTNGKFVSWGGACSAFGSNPVCQINNLQNNVSINANFDADQQIIATNDSQSTQQGQILGINAATLTQNDISAYSRPFSIISVGNAVGGTVSLASNVITFIPNVLTGEAASFDYVIRDSLNFSTTGSVIVDITPLPQIQALLFDSSEFEYINDLLTAAPPTLADLFDSWGRFEERAASNYTAVAGIVASPLTVPGAVTGTVYPLPTATRFYPNKQSALDARAIFFPAPLGTQVVQGLVNSSWVWFESLSWQFLTSPDRVESTVNSNNYIGFVSPKKYDDYELEVTLKSTNTDDDTVGVVVAYYRDEVTNMGYTLSISRTQGGNAPANGFGFSYNIGQTGTAYFASKDVGGVYKNITGVTEVPLSERNGWSSRTSRIKIQRKGDLIKAYAGVWNAPDVEPTSLIELNLNDNPVLEKFKGPQKYGFAAYSQANSTFTDIVFSAGGDLNQNLIYDLQNQIVYEYIAGSWVVANVDFAESLGYPREIYNPQTDKTYMIDANGVISLVNP